MQYTYSQVLKHMLASRGISLRHVSCMKLHKFAKDDWTFTCYDDNDKYVVFKRDAFSQTLIFNYVHVLHPIPDTFEEQCKMFLDTCFKLVQEHEIYLYLYFPVGWSTRQFMSRGMTLEQVLIEIDLQDVQRHESKVETLVNPVYESLEYMYNDRIKSTHSAYEILTHLNGGRDINFIRTVKQHKSWHLVGYAHETGLCTAKSAWYHAFAGSGPMLITCEMNEDDWFETKCKKFLDKCFEIARSENIYSFPIYEMHDDLGIILRKGTTLEQVLIDMNLQVA